MMFWYGNGMGGWGYALMTISMVLFWGLVIAGVVALIRYLGRPSQQAGVHEAPRFTAEDVLAERFARGEIDEQEYRRGLDTLHINTRTPAAKS